MKDVILNKLRVDEKIKLLTGVDGFTALKLPGDQKGRLRMSDGPFGVKLKSMPVCFLNTCLMASSFDREICYEIGKMIGAECREANVNLLLAPAINIKRNPLAGRNFEYYSEDPVLTGLLAAEFIKGLHSENVGCCMKHFACNNQETRRWTQNSAVNEDALRNIYLKAFEKLVREKLADSIMTSYNQINGVYGGENEFLLKKILCEEWGFEGVTVSDWASVSDICIAIKNGLDLEMPGNAELSYPKLKAAFENGTLSEKEIDEKLSKLLCLAERFNQATENTPKTEIDIEKVVRYTAESFVLLKNNGILPLGHNEKILIVGGAAREPRIQGGGCANLGCEKISSPLDEIRMFHPKAAYIESYELSETQFQAVNDYDKIVVFLSLGEYYDSEAFDRENMFFPHEQVECVKKLAGAHKKLVLILSNGSAVDLSFEDCAGAILETYYAGDCFGKALARVLFGKISPCGKLAESFPMRLEDVPSDGQFGKKETVVYDEGEFVGYRYYTSFGVKTRYPFGYGMSYAKFNIDRIDVEKTGTYEVTVAFTVENISSFDGKEVVQIYIKRNSRFLPKLQLANFDVVRLTPGERKIQKIRLEKDAFERYVGGKKAVFDKEVIVCVARSSEEILFEKTISLTEESVEFGKDTVLGDLLEDERYRTVALDYLREAINLWAYNDKNSKKNFEKDKFLRESIYCMPIRGIAYFSDGKLNDFRIEELLNKLRNIRDGMKK